MADGEGTRDKKIQATISAELKEQVRELVKDKGFESEAEFLRTAITEYIIHQTNPPARTLSSDISSNLLPHPDELHHDLKERIDLVAWMLTVGLVLVSSLGSKLLHALGEKDIEPMKLLNESLQTAVQERITLRRKLGIGWRAFNRAGQHQNNGVHKH
ncbi:MAG: ribbon-helix-helix domain-containing protein [Anaerolineae bacterium]|nr:ribbon-helix-helix domain-containing protein [Anaerolineae bacterium]